MADGGAEVDDAAVALDSDWGHHAVCERCGSDNLQPTAYGELVCLDCGTQSQDVRQMVTEEAEEDLERRAVQATHRIRQQPRDKGPRRATVHDVFNSFDLLLAFQTLLESMVVALVDHCDCPAQLHAVVGAIWHRYLSRWSHAGAPLAYVVHQAPHMPPGRTFYSRLAADGFARPPGIVPLSMDLLLAACYAGCRWLSDPLLPADISTYVHNGTLPFFHAFQSLPAALRVTNAAAHRLFTPACMCEPAQLERLAAALAYNVGVSPLPIANFGALLVRVTSLLHLPAGVLVAANQLLALDEHDRLFAAAYCSKGYKKKRKERVDAGTAAAAGGKGGLATSSAAGGAASAAGGRASSAVGGTKRKRPGDAGGDAGAVSDDSDISDYDGDAGGRAGRKLDANVTYQSDSDAEVAAGLGADGRHPPRKRRRWEGLADAGPGADASKFFGVPGDREDSTLDLLARLRKRCDYGDSGGPYVAALLAVAMQLTPGWTAWVHMHCRAHMDDGIGAVSPPELMGGSATAAIGVRALTVAPSGPRAAGVASAVMPVSSDAASSAASLPSSGSLQQLTLVPQAAALAVADTPMPWTPGQLAVMPPGSIRSYADFVAAKVLRGGMSLSLGDGAHHFDSFKGTLMSYSDPAVTLTAAVSDAAVTDAIAARQQEAALASGALVPAATGPTVSEDDVLVSMLSVPPMLSQDSDAGDDVFPASQTSVGGPRAGSSVDGGSRRSTPASSVTGASSAGGSRGRGGLALQAQTLEVALPSRRQQPGAQRQEEGGLWPVSQLPAVMEASAAIAGIADVVDAVAPPEPAATPAPPAGAALPTGGAEAAVASSAAGASSGFEPFMVMLSRLHIEASSVHLSPEHLPLDHVPVELAALLRALAAHVACPVAVILDHVLVLQALLQSYTALPPRAVARGHARQLHGERLAVAAVAGLPVTAGELGLTRVPPDTPVRVAGGALVSIPSLKKALAAADVKYATREAERQRKSLVALTTPAGGKAAAAAAVVAAAGSGGGPADGLETHAAAADLVAMRGTAE